jgi:hypothetical protein
MQEASILTVCREGALYKMTPKRRDGQQRQSSYDVIDEHDLVGWNLYSQFPSYLVRYIRKPLNNFQEVTRELSMHGVGQLSVREAR